MTERPDIACVRWTPSVSVAFLLRAPEVQAHPDRRTVYVVTLAGAPLYVGRTRFSIG